MKGSQKADRITLNLLISNLKEGKYVIPDFQRDFEWKPWDITSLIRSIFLDYYIGSLLLWKGKSENFNALSCESIYGFNNKRNHESSSLAENPPEFIVLDGQQRLTAMHYAFIAPQLPLPKRTLQAIYYIRIDLFMDEAYEEAFSYEWISKKLSRLLENQESQFEEHFFPLSVVGKGGYEIYKWFDEYVKYWQSKADQCNEAEVKNIALEAVKNGTKFREVVNSIDSEYQVSFIELAEELEVDKVCDIFTQINSRGIRLDAFDLINALLKPKGLQLKHMWRKASDRLAFVESDKMNVYVLQVMSILKQNYCSPKYLYYLLPGQSKTIRKESGEFSEEILISSAEEFESSWNEAVDSLESAIRLLKHPNEFGVTSSQYLPYVSIIPVFRIAGSLRKFTEMSS